LVRLFFLALLPLIIAAAGDSEKAPEIVWQKTYGGSGKDAASSITPGGDGGDVVVGAMASSGAGKGDFWILKLGP